MKMPDDLAEAFNGQLTLELASSVAYLQMAAYFEAQGLPGMASWMIHQSDEEKEHAHRFFEFVASRGNRVEIGAIEAPSSQFDSVEAVFAAALSQEQAVSQSIHDLYLLADERGDLASLPFLHGFIDEQNEEEATIEGILERVRLAGDEASAILLLDSELGSRS